MIELISFLDKMTDITVAAVIVHGIVAFLLAGVALTVVISIVQKVKEARNDHF